MDSRLRAIPYSRRETRVTLAQDACAARLHGIVYHDYRHSDLQTHRLYIQDLYKYDFHSWDVVEELRSRSCTREGPKQSNPPEDIPLILLRGRLGPPPRPSNYKAADRRDIARDVLREWN